MKYRITNIMDDNRVFTDNRGNHVLKPRESIITDNPPKTNGAFRVRPVIEKTEERKKIKESEK